MKSSTFIGQMFELQKLATLSPQEQNTREISGLCNFLVATSRADLLANVISAKL